MLESQSSLVALADFLASIQIFQGLPQQQLNEIAHRCRLQRYEKGETIFCQGEPGSGFFIVRTGRVKVFQLAGNGREQILHVFEAGAHFAEVPAFDGKCYPASAATLSAAEMLFFPRQPFLQLLETDPAIAINLLKSFARHLRRFSNLVDTLSLKEVPGRLAVYLLNLQARDRDSTQVELDLGKWQLAAMLGTIPETLSRTLLKLGKAGIIRVEGSKIDLLDLDALRQLAE